ncbi:MAG: anaerobic ribonucleoside-triphosphate reductase, partial [Succiniclasticum sp.]|nr:anaerobic ribonucleoside-triphosphate reductase [Succiniclasticum sp.]
MTYFKNVVKRNGITVPFDEKKIENAIAKAFIATGEVEARNVSTIAGAITLMVITNLRENSQEIPTVEDIQDRVESMLMKCDYVKTAKAYILYRKQHQQARHTKNTLLDYKKLVDGYIGKDKDWRVKENSTVTLSVGALILSNSGAITANYWLSEIYDEDIAEAHRKCFIHLHDLSMLTGYCAGWSLKQLIQEGLGGVPDRISSAPAKHLSTLCNQMVNFLGIMQNEWAGAQAFSSFDTYLAPFVKADHLDYKEVKQCIQSFIY